MKRRSPYYTELLSGKQLSERLGISYKTVKKEVKKDDFPKYKIGKRHYYMYLEALSYFKVENNNE